MKKYVVGVDAPDLAIEKIEKNVQLVAEIKYINFGIKGSLGGAHRKYFDVFSTWIYKNEISQKN